MSLIKRTHINPPNTGLQLWPVVPWAVLLDQFQKVLANGIPAVGFSISIFVFVRDF